MFAAFYLLIVLAPTLYAETCTSNNDVSQSCSPDTAASCTERPPVAPSTQFLGVGYNLLTGNPDDTSRGVDPGIKVNRRIMKLTTNCSKTTSDGKYLLPDQAYFSRRLSCNVQELTEVTQNAAQLRDQLRVNVGVEASGSYGLFDFAFTANNNFQKEEKKFEKKGRFVFSKTRTCERGTARYLLGNRQQSDIGLSEEFEASIRSLPAKYADSRATYCSFLENWGTHFIREIDSGSKYTESYESTTSESAKYAMQNNAAGVSFSGGALGQTLSASVQVRTLAEDEKYLMSLLSTKKVINKGSSIYWNGQTYVVPPGSENVEPLKLKLSSIASVLNCDFTTDEEVISRKKEIETALRNYGTSCGLSVSLPQNALHATQFKYWPKDTYGLIKPSGVDCEKYSSIPGTNEWLEGTRFQDTESSSRFSNSPLKVDAVLDHYNNVRWKFCIRVTNNVRNSLVDLSQHFPWPTGSYCILKKINCPTGFKNKEIFWDDEDTSHNWFQGTLPDGTYNYDTRMEFCCRNDGLTSTPMYLPTETPFILMPTSPACQQVVGMTVEQEWIVWDDENTDNDDYNSPTQPRPYDSWPTRYEHQLHFCYYEAK
ncbi:uncharacterized protein [Oscarella lobularis]|uniref:uncharacterized protein n=1 Tax=Oscarella lobularis TaxID=121494 RepID=UPI0033136846